MSAIGGSIEQVSVKGRNFAVAADADAARDLGGFTNEIQMNGDGTKRTIKTRKPWVLTGLTLSIDDDRGDQEFLQDIADSKEDVAIAATFASGAVWEGQGTITDELQFSSQNSTVEVSFGGGGRMTKQ